jgi:hypothetical protein
MASTYEEPGLSAVHPQLFEENRHQREEGPIGGKKEQIEKPGDLKRGEKET